MVFLEVALQSIVVNIVLLLAMGGTAVANMASFVFITTMGVQLVIAIESLPTKTTLGVAFEAALVDSTGFVITMLLVFSQLGHGEEGVLVSEHLFVPCAEVTVMSHRVRVSHLVLIIVFNAPISHLGNSIKTHHITLPCLLFTWRCKSGHPRQATSQSSSGQLYRSSNTVSSKISSFS